MGVSHLNNRMVEASSIMQMDNKWSCTTFLAFKKLSGEDGFSIYTGGFSKWGP